MGVLDDFLFKKYGALTRGVDNPIIDPGTVGTTPTMFLRRNGNRIGYTVVNLSPNTVYLGYEGDVSASRGILLDPSGGSMHSWIEQDGELTQREVWLIASGVGSSVNVVETEVM